MDAKRIVRSSRLTIWAAVAIAAMLGERVVAQGVVMERNLSLAMAKTSAEAALAECKSKGYHTSKAGIRNVADLLKSIQAVNATQSSCHRS